MTHGELKNLTKSLFTFQSGDIQIQKLYHITPPDTYLHSNLVIFKYNITFDDAVSPTGFTFQSGDIQILLMNVFHFLFFLFTFQSGDIQIAPISSAFFVSFLIYIPIW